MISSHDVAALLLERQHLAHPAGEEDYDRLFRDLSPVKTPYWCAPGSPPCLRFRAAFDDGDYNDRRRAARRILKGRFQKGNLAYIAAEDLELFAALYRRPPEKMTLEHHRLLDLLEREGPLTIQQIKEITGLLVKHITPLLHRLQEMFLVYEDQTDAGWDRGWYAMEQEFEGVRFDRFTPEQALDELLPRYARRAVFFNADSLGAFYQLPAKACAASVDRLMKTGVLAAAEVGGRQGWMLREDRDLLESGAPEIVPGVFALDRNDFLVKWGGASLAGDYPPAGEWETLFYLSLIHI